MGDTTALDLVALQEALIGRYSLEHELGRGGMGVVYLAHDVRLDRPVALKLLPPAYAARAPLRDRFLREARTAARLSHPHIVPIHAVEEVGDFVFFVMAYIEGETLGERIRARGPVPPREATRILREVSWALGYAHAQGVVHRDVKPDNILLEAGSGRALVTDFGIAQVSEAARSTQENEILGTAEFMAPEQAAGDPIDERSDIYALGVVGHYMLAGRLPLQGQSVAATLAKQITQPAPALRAVAPEVPSHLAHAIDRCLEKDPALRFSGAEELSDAFGKALETRREMPASIRLFVEQSRESAPAVLALSAWAALTLVMFVFLIATGNDMPIPVVAFLGLFWAAMAGAPLFLVVHLARRLLKSGYGYEDLVRSLERDLHERRRELRSHGEGMTRLDRWSKGIAVWGGGVSLTALIALGWGPFISETVAAIQGLVAFGGTGVASLAGIVAAVRHHLRGTVGGERWFKVWMSPVGKLVFKLARVGLGRVSGGESAFRPTEMAISLAADRLYQELPDDLKASLADLPGVVRRLEEDAEAMRARVDELNEILEGVSPTAGEPGARASSAEVAGQRDALAGDVRETRDTARERLTQLVAALETIRLGLLRLHAGAGSVEGMTADLGAARDLSDEIAHALEGNRQVEELLGTPEPARELETPLPG